MMYGHEKSDLAIVAEKPTNKAERSAAEPVERRAGTKGNAGQLSTCRTQCRTSVTQGVGSHAATYCRRYPRWEPYAGKPHVRICAGGREDSRPYREQDPTRLSRSTPSQRPGSLNGEPLDGSCLGFHDRVGSNPKQRHGHLLVGLPLYAERPECCDGEYQEYFTEPSLQGYSPVRVPWVVSFFAALK
jgi:hypothetical protein